MNILLYTLLTLGVIGLFASIFLFYVAKKFSVPVDPRIDEIAKVLPGANCGACGYASCRALARAILEGEAAATICVVGGAEAASKIAEILGKPVEVTETIKKVAVVQCQGGKDVAKERFKYIGLEDCRAALLVSGGPKACIWGCLGLGSCVRICSFGAITMGQDGIPVIDESRCTACGMCVKACPRGIIALIPKEQKVYLGCVSRDKAKKVRDVCKAGCITCGICVKVSPEGVITMGDNLPQIHWEKGKDLKRLLEEAIKKCPNKCFVVRKVNLATGEHR